MSTANKRLGTVVLALMVAITLSTLGLVWLARYALKPAPGEWATQLHLGPVTLQVSVPSLIWLGTTPWIANLLDGHHLPTPLGTVQLHWQPDSEALVLRCNPCTLPARALGSEALHIEEGQLQVHRRGAKLEGTLSAGALTATWHGSLSPQSLALGVDLPASPIRDGYALFANSMPELQRATINGTFSLKASITWPTGKYTVKPHVEGFAVQGLGTEALMGAKTTCNKDWRSSRVRTDSVLARAVIAAEDQRFYEHAGFDLAELTASFQRNHHEERIERGASTLSQQVARLLITGAERTPTRKLRELLYAVEMEQTLGKARILRLYLENAPWGNGVCGASAAARHYFDNPVKDLDAAQAVWLAAMLHHPTMEAQLWANQGHINIARAQWVATSLRPMPRTEREELAQYLTKVDWAAPAVHR